MPTGNKADRVHPNPAPHHPRPGDNLLRRRKGIGSKSTKKTPEPCKTRTKENRSIEILTTEQSVADRKTLNLPCTATAKSNISFVTSTGCTKSAAARLRTPSQTQARTKSRLIV